MGSALPAEQSLRTFIFGRATAAQTEWSGVTLDYKLERRKISVMQMQQRTGIRIGTFGTTGGDVVQAGGGSESRDGICFTVHAVGTGVRQVRPAGSVQTPTILSLGAGL
jgi:hypothetical protein